MPLPSLSRGSSSQLQALTPVPMVPEWVSQRGQVIARLIKIECVDVKSVVDKRGDRSYVVEIYESTSKNRIPTNRNTRRLPLSQSPAISAPQILSVASLDSSCKPTAHIERQFSEFAALRSEAYNHAHMAHSMVPCEFCKGVIDEIVWGNNQPGSLLKLLANEDKVVRRLAKSVNAFLALVKSNGEGGRLCTGQDNVSQVLYDFLFTVEEQTAVEASLATR